MPRRGETRRERLEPAALGGRCHAPPTVRARLAGCSGCAGPSSWCGRCAPRLTLAGYALTVLQALLPLAGLYLIKLIVDAVTAGIGSADPAAALHRAATWIASQPAVGILTALAAALSGLVTETQSAVVTDAMSDLLHAKSVEVDLEYYENPSSSTTPSTAPSRRRPSARCESSAASACSPRAGSRSPRSPPCSRRSTPPSRSCS